MELDERALGAAVEAWIGADKKTRFFFDNDDNCLRAAITAYLTAIGETHVLVPREPTAARIDAGIRAMDMAVTPTSRAAFRRSYRAMLAAVKEGE